MPILSQTLPAALASYASQAIQPDTLAEIFSECFYVSLLERCPNHLLVKLAPRLDFQPIETACAAFRHQDGPGTRPTYSIPVLVRCLQVMYVYDLSLRRFEERLYSDMAVRWFVGLSAFEKVPDHSTLERFVLWVSQNHPGIYQDTLLKQVDEMYPQSRKLNQVGDTYAMLANAAEEDLTTRLRHTVHCLLREAVQTMPDLLTPTVSRFAWHELFGAPKEIHSFALNKKQRQQRIQAVVLAADALRQRFTTLLQAYPSQDYPDVRMWVGYLAKITHDEVVILAEPAPDGSRIHLRTTQERRNDPETNSRIGSATDPEASYRRHGEDKEDITFGYNIQVSASTDGFIRETQAYTGSVSDQVGIAPLIAAQLEHQGACPPKLIYDMAAGSGKARADVDQASQGKTQLVSKLLPFENRTDRFGPYDFTLSEDGQTLTCPAGKQSSSAYASGSADGRSFRFLACQCWLNADPPARMKQADLSQRCPLWQKCRDNRQGPGSMRQVFISDYRNYVLAAKDYNQSDIFQLEIKQRPHIERIVFELTHYNGARRCRRCGLANADWQARMSAVSYNLKLWMRKIGRSERTAPAAG